MAQHIKRTNEDKYARGESDAPIETIDFIADKFELESFALGNVIKYVVRYRATRNCTDLLKAAHYLGMVYEEHKPVEINDNDWKPVKTTTMNP